MKLSTIFRRIDKLYSNPQRWVSGQYSEYKTLRGKNVECYCLVGALNKVTGAFSSSSDADRPEYKALKRSIKQLHTGHRGSIESWNDRKRRTIGEIRAVVKRALKNAVAAGA